MKRTPIAIVGMACRLPGANDIDGFWNLVSQGKSAIARIPDDRLDRRLYYDPKVGTVGRSYTDKAALVDYSDAAVPGGCITESDVRDHDAAHITLCRVVDRAIEHGRLSRESLRRSRTGVFFGHAALSGRGSEYVYATGIPQIAEYLREVVSLDAFPAETRERLITELTAEVRARTPWRSAGNSPFLAAGDAAQMVADKFQLNGPSMVFNSACASSLQAIGHAMKSLQLGRIDTAVVGGASYLHSDTLVLFSAAQSLSADGSWPFTQKANGLIAGEGYVVFVIKTLEKALTDNDRVYAVLPGVGISCDGRGKSLWAPLPDGQVYAMRRAYDNPADFAKIEYIEGHFTSTHLGDKTEILSITQALQDYPRTKKRIPVGSVKGNVGHCLEVAGAVGLLKVVLALQNDLIPAAVDSAMPLNKDVDWKNVPLFPPSSALPWRPHADGTPRRSGVNAFGIGGLNVHLAVEDFPGAGRSGAVQIPVSQRPEKTSTEENAVAIVGVGTVLPGVLDFATFCELLRSSTRAIRPVSKKPWDARLLADRSRWHDKAIEMPGGGVIENFEYDWKAHGIPPKQLAQASPLQFMILDAVDQALKQANYDVQNDELRMTTGCVVGTSFGGDFATQLIMGLRQPETCEIVSRFLRQNGCPDDVAATILDEFQKITLRHMPALIDETGSFTSSALASRITKSFDFKGGGVAVEASDVSAFAALLCCVDTLITGSCDTMICIAGQHDMSPGAFHEYSLNGRIAASERFAAPYDAASQGVLPGEGCVAFVLKRLADAQRDGDRILGIVRGIGAAKNRSVRQAVLDAVVEARESSGVASENVRAVELTGLGVPDIDREELRTLDSLYPQKTGRIPAATTVDRFGHLNAASGFVTLLSAMTALEDETMHATVAFSACDDETRLDHLELSNGSQKIATSYPEGKLYAGVNACSDLRNAYHIILQRGTPVKPEISPSNSDSSCYQVEQISPRVFHFDATVRRKERLRGVVHANPVVVTPVVSATPATDPTPQTVLDPAELRKYLVDLVVAKTGYPAEIVDLDEQLDEGLGFDEIMKTELFDDIKRTYGVQIDPKMSTDGFPTLRIIADFLADGKAAPSVAASPPPASIPVTPTVVETPAPAANDSPSLDAQELEAFLVKFVVDQTGYPEEHVTLDVDLEDGLSIDSIKKAQLFGELGEYFDLQVSGDVSLDDFTTLRHVLDFLLANASSSDVASMPANPAPAPVASIPVAASPPPASIPVTPTVVETPAPAANDSPSLDAQELEAFLVKFVVDQTGYPEEHVTLDVDLEDGLSIDSIKKAQLFGELGEYFDLQVSGDVSLDDFTTLRHVLDYILQNAK